jgi:hypothetical protein
MFLLIKFINWWSDRGKVEEASLKEAYEQDIAEVTRQRWEIEKRKTKRNDDDDCRNER